MVQIASAVRVAIGEMFGFAPGTDFTGRMVAGLRQLGFNGVFDTNFGADLTIMEEATEIISRVTKGENLPPRAPAGSTSWNSSSRSGQHPLQLQEPPADVELPSPRATTPKRSA